MLIVSGNEKSCCPTYKAYSVADAFAKLGKSMKTSGNKKALESAITDWLVELIKSGKLSQSITNMDTLTSITEASRQPNIIPSFSMDYASRIASAKAGEYVLNQLRLLELVAVDKSASLDKRDVLRPDIVAFNPETKTLIVFEVKRETLTERQAVTELLGYEQELRNMFLFLGNFDICFVVVSRDWSTLLDHAVSGMITWSGKQCLALQLDFDTVPRELSCHLPEAWHIRGSFGVPPEALQAVDIPLYDDLAEDVDDFPPRVVETAMNIIARNGDRAQAHGFVMLWEDKNTLGMARWILTLCAIDPISMFYWCVQNGLPHRDSELSKFFKGQENDLLPASVPPSAFRICDDALRLLRNRFSPKVESFETWHEKLLQLKLRSRPVRFEFWGALGDYARAFVCNPGVRDQLMPYLGVNELDWTDVEVAVPLIEEISGKRPFPDGVVRCNDSFLVGVALGTLALAYANERPDESGYRQASSLVIWAELGVLCFAIEMQQIYHASSSLNTPIPSLRRDYESREKSVAEIVRWILDHLIGEMEPAHQASFYVGYKGAAFFNEWLGPHTASQVGSKHRTVLADHIKIVLYETLTNCRDISAEVIPVEILRLLKVLQPGTTADVVRDAEQLKKLVDTLETDLLLENFRHVVLPAADSQIPAVMDTNSPMPTLDVDWEWLKKGVKQIFDAGERWPAVIIQANGIVASGVLTGHVRVMPPITDPDKEVFFLDEAANFSFAIKVTWEKLIQDGIPKRQ